MPVKQLKRAFSLGLAYALSVKPGLCVT